MIDEDPDDKCYYLFAKDVLGVNIQKLQNKIDMIMKNVDEHLL